MKRELPTINIEGTDFIVDVHKAELRQKSNSSNSISIFDMRDIGNGYEFEYNPESKNISSPYRKHSIIVQIPEMVAMDPIGMAQKYNLDEVSITGKSDLTLMVDETALDMRLNKCMLPTIDIAGHPFYVDINMDMLRPKDDLLSKGIVFSDIEAYYDEDRSCYSIPYNPHTREFQEIDYRVITELPKKLILLEFPYERKLDMVGWNRKYGYDETYGLKESGLKVHFEANTVAWETTVVPDIIEMNLEAEKQQRQMKVIDEIATKLEEGGYEYFNFSSGRPGVNFKEGITSYLYDAGILNKEPFPIYFATNVAATSPDEPASWASFLIIQDPQKELRIDSIKLTMYECHEGAVRASFDLKLQSVADIPSRLQAAKMIEDKWEKQYAENRKKWNKPMKANTQKTKGRRW